MTEHSFERDIGERIELVDFQREDGDHFMRLNVGWIEEHFVLEPEDRLYLEDPINSILEPGGHIIMARYEGEVVGTCALIYAGAGVYELSKMAVTKAAHGRGIGLALGKAAIERARKHDARRIFLVSNTVLEPAIGLYRKLGFREVRMQQSPYARGNIQMELELS